MLGGHGSGGGADVGEAGSVVDFAGHFVEQRLDGVVKRLQARAQQGRALASVAVRAEDGQREQLDALFLRFRAAAQAFVHIVAAAVDDNVAGLDVERSSKEVPQGREEPFACCDQC